MPMGKRKRRRSSTYSSLFPFFLFFSSYFWLPTSVSAATNEQPFVGVTIGTDVSNILSPTDLASFLQSQQITHVRLYDPDARLLSALSGTGIKILVGVPNDELIALGSSPTTASSWVSRRLLPYANTTDFAGVAVGDEVPDAVPSALPVLLPALQSIASALAAAKLQIPVSTPLPFSLVLDPFPPSQAYFNQTLVSSFVLPLLGFLSNTSSPLMLNLYPYYSLMQSNGVVPLDNALFKPLPPSLEMVDPNTLLHYTNVFDAMVDAVYVAMKNLNVTDVPVLVTETGWPSVGDPKVEPYATKDNAETYNSNVIKHVFDKAGTPMRPAMQSSVFIYELFNEDLRPGPISEENWGLFYGNGTAVYLLHVNGTGGFLANDTTDRTFCIAMDGADVKALQSALDWACGPGRADCTAIQPGEMCYMPNDVKSHASYAFDSYYQMEGKVTGSCYFQGAGVVTTTDPSNGSCIFPGSKLLKNVTKPSDTNTTTQSTQTSDAEGSAIWRLRKGRESYSLYFLPVIISTVLVVAMTTSNFWT